MSDELTEEQRDDELQTWRLQKALEEAPELLQHVRAVALSSPEPGETLREWNAPMRISAADAADLAYVALITYSMQFADDLHLALGNQAAAAAAMANADAQKGTQGFSSNCQPGGAYVLTSLFTGFLRAHSTAIEQHEDYTDYRDVVVDVLAKLKAQYPIQQRRRRDAAARKCPNCGEVAVRAEWASADMADARVRCELCGHELPVTGPVLRWIKEAA